MTDADREAPSTSWSVWAWQAYRDGRLVEANPAAIREALLSLPAVYAHQINTGVREVYDPLQRFYTMESVLTALKGDDHD